MATATACVDAMRSIAMYNRWENFAVHQAFGFCTHQTFTCSSPTLAVAGTADPFAAGE